MPLRRSDSSKPFWLVLDVHGVLIPSSEKWILSQVARQTRQPKWLLYLRWASNLMAAQKGKLPARKFYERVLDRTLSEKDFQSVIMSKYAQRASISPHVLTQLTRLKKKGWKLAILSDMNTAQADFHRAKKTFALFDQVSFSCENGLMKPFPDSFDALERRLRTRKDHIVFVDDLWFNTLSAQLHGWRGLTLKGKYLAHFLRDLD